MLMSNVLSRYRELLRLLRRLPLDQQKGALEEARSTTRARALESDPQKALDYQRELASRIGFLRATTPKQPGEVTSTAGTYVFRGGQLVKGCGEVKGSRYDPADDGCA